MSQALRHHLVTHGGKHLIRLEWFPSNTNTPSIHILSFQYTWDTPIGQNDSKPRLTSQHGSECMKPELATLYNDQTVLN